jgi:hypothetical protein
MEAINMNKIIPIIVVGILIFSGFGAIAITGDTTHSIKIDKTLEKIEISFPQLIIGEYDKDYVKLSFEDSAYYLMNSGQPMVPKVVRTFELPFGARNVKVDVTPKTVRDREINKEIRPAPISVPLISGIQNVDVRPKKDLEVYASSELFPSTWYQYRVGCGLNAANERVTHVSIHLFPVRYIPTEGRLYIAESAEITITFEEPMSNPFPLNSAYDLVIIAPSKFADDLQRLVDHKNSFDIETKLKTTEEIYNEYPGVDKPEQIKYFIKDALETWDVKYVLLVGGLKSLIWGKPRDDCNQGTKDWHLPVRYNNLFDDPEHPLEASGIHDPGVISDLYYADIYENEGNFSSWDPNGDGVFASWSKPGVANDTQIDLYPDVCLGRLACRNNREVEIMVDKIIKYEQTPADPSWFKKMIVVSGDGFLDQGDLDIQWDVNGIPDGEYTIYAQSENPDGIKGPIDELHVTLDRTVETNLSFNHDDHLQPGYKNYPAPPIAEIVSVSDGDILGNTDFTYTPRDSEAYCNDFTGWANMSYVDGVLAIRGKSYDPQPYGNLTDIHVWIENSDGQAIFSQWRNNTEMYYEGEWVTGEKLLEGKGGALYYMPDDFEKEILWTSNGKFTGQEDVIESLNEGSGFVFFSGHGSPQVWGDHWPGVPGNRRHGSITGLVTCTLSANSIRYLRFITPFLPVEEISNIDKPFVLVVGGCHNSQFNVSLLATFFDGWLLPSIKMWTYGGVAPECWSWWLTRLSERGAIATIGNTGLGYGTMGKECTIGGLDGGISLEFFRQYGEEGHDILGETYKQTLTYYANNFDMQEDDHVKTLVQWVLLGDPSLKIGGYSKP